MEWLNALGAFVVGIGLRFGVPLALTALAALLLRRLDGAWQREAEARRMRPSSVGAALRQVRCWEELDCPSERRAACPAYAQPDMPCWQAFRDREGRLREACLECVVLREAPVPHPA